MLFLTTETGSEAQQIVDQIATDFKSATGANVQVEYLGYDEQDQRVTQLLQAGNPPEVVSESIGTLPLYGGDTVANLDGVVETFEERYGDVPSGQRYQVDGSDYFAPLWINSDMYWYREDIVSSPRPDSWSNALTMAENAGGTDGLAGTFVANGQSVCIDYNTLSWGYTNGAKSVKWDGDEVVSALADEQNRGRWIEALDQIKQMHQYSPQAADAGCTQQVNAIPNRISTASPYYGARPKIQSIERGRDFAGSVRAELFPSKEEKTVHGGAEGWVVFQDANTEVGRTFIEFMYRPQYFMQFLFLSPLHNVPPGNAGQSDQFQERLEDLPDAWSQQDIEKTFERARDIQIPNTETEPANGVGRALVNNRVFATMRFNAVIRDNDPETVIDNTHQRANEMLSQAQQ